MDNNFIEVIFAIGAVVLIVIFFKYFLIVLGVAVVAIALISIVTYVKKQNKRKEMVLEDVSKGSIDDFIKKSNTRIQNLRRYYYKLKEDDMKEYLDKITAGLKKMISILKNDPRDYKAIRRFLNTAFDSCDKILSQSAQLYSIEVPSEKTKEGLKNAKEGLNLLSTAIDNQINKLYDNNTMDLDIEVKVLKQVLGAKGLINESYKENEDD